MERRNRGDVMDVKNLGQFVQVGLDKRCSLSIDPDYDRHSRNFLQVCVSDSQRLNVVPSPPEQRRNPVQNARMIGNVDNKSAYHVHASDAAVSTSGLGRRIIWCRAAPLGTMGNTESSCSTMKLISAVPRRFRASRIIGPTCSRLRAVSPSNPNASASLAKSGLSRGVAE